MDCINIEASGSGEEYVGCVCVCVALIKRKREREEAQSSTLGVRWSVHVSCSGWWMSHIPRAMHIASRGLYAVGLSAFLFGDLFKGNRQVIIALSAHNFMLFPSVMAPSFPHLNPLSLYLSLV